MIELGSFALFFALPIAIYAAAAPIIGIILGKKELIKSAKYAVYANGVVLTVAAAGLIYAFLNDRFDIAYVFEYSNTTQPLAYKLAAFYGGQAGSLLFWAWMLALYMVIVVYQNRRKNQDLMPYVLFIAMTVETFFIFIMTMAPALFTLSSSVKMIAQVFSAAFLVASIITIIAVGISKLFDKFSSKHFKEIICIGILVISIFFFSTLALYAKESGNSAPFEKTATKMPQLVTQLQKELGTSVPTEGEGLNPLLQNYGMIFHPPALYMGYVGFTIPFAFALAALMTKNLGTVWITSTRKWTIWAWFALGVGIVFGAQWAYMELGWGGYWAWDPVENASFMPWLTGTAFMHSVMIQEKKNMLKVWNMLLIIFTFALSLFGTYLTRSGVLSSVHSFGTSPLGAQFLTAMFISLVFAMILLALRLDSLKSENELDSLLSREATFLINNLLLVGAAFTVFWGTVFPLVSEALGQGKPTVGPPFYEKIMVPIALVLFLVTAICPLIAWRRATRKNLAKNFAKPFTTAIIVGVGLSLLIGAAVTQQVGFLAGLIALTILIVVATINQKLVFPVGALSIGGAAVFFALNSAEGMRFIMPGFLFATLAGSAYAISKNRESKVGLGLGIGAISSLALVFGSTRIEHPWALGTLFLLTFITATIVLEFYRGTRIRLQHDKERVGSIGFDPMDILRVFKAFGTLIWKNKRRYGGYIIHTGIVIMFVGITASSTWKIEKEANLKQGQSTKLGAYTLTYDKTDYYKTSNKEVLAATLGLSKPLGNGLYSTGQVVAEKNWHPNPYKSEEENQPTTEVGLFWNLKEDVYIILNGFDPKSKITSFKMVINPLIVWIWIGGFVVIFGTIIVMWPDALEKRRLAAKYGSAA